MTLGLEQSALYLVAALVLGAAIGAERQWRQRLAGMRTHALVAVGSAGFVVFSQLVAGEMSPTRVAAQVVSGIGFLGAGVIFRQGADVKGLNTAATLWCSAAVGVLAGIGALAHAALLTALVVAIHLLLRPLVKAVRRRFPREAGAADPGGGGTYHLHLLCPADALPALRAALAEGVATLPDSELMRLDGVLLAAGSAEIEAEVAARAGIGVALERLLATLARDHAVTASRWRLDAAAD